MSGWLLDTNVLSELRRPRCDANVKAWMEDRPASMLYVSEIVFAEIRYGAGQIDDANLRHEINQWLDTHLRPWFAGRVFAVTEDVIVRWREMVQIGRSKNHTFSQPDLFLAAIADLHGLCVVTRNVKDFEVAGVPVVNPWEAEKTGKA